MPPGVTSNTSKKKIRPSSASANLQTHPCYRTSLYDDRTAVGGGPLTGPSVLQRPKTQAGGPRSQWASRPHQAAGFDAELPKHRRKTLGPVDNIANTDYTSRKLGQPSVGAQLKGKVGHLTIFLKSGTLSVFGEVTASLNRGNRPPFQNKLDSIH